MDIALCLDHGHVLTLSGVTEETLRNLLTSMSPGIPMAIEHEGGIVYVAPARVVAVQSS